MSDIYDEFDANVDTDGLAKDVKDAENGGDRRDVPHGKYEVGVNRIELKKSNSGKPMVSIWFKVLAGEFKGSLIFFNQVITQGFQIHIVNELCRKLSDGKVKMEFVNYKQYNQLLLDVFEVSGNYEYALNYKAGKNDFSEYKIEDVFELED